MATEFTARVISVITAIPLGKVLSYGQVAALAGNPRAARQVVRILHTQSRKHALPWHRVVNTQGQITLNDPFGAEEQRLRLEAEGVKVSEERQVDLATYLWQGRP